MGFRCWWTNENNRINATKGVYAIASTNLSGGFRINDDEVFSVFGGGIEFPETRFNIRAYQPLVESERLIFRYNGTIGAIHSTDGSIVPYIHRYRAGGINSIRGYGWFTLGPSVRAQGYLPSNQSAFVGSDDPAASDARLVVGEPNMDQQCGDRDSDHSFAEIRAVTFFDAGNAFGDPWGNGSINFARFTNGLRRWIRWLSPMGPLRFF